MLSGIAYLIKIKFPKYESALGYTFPQKLCKGIVLL